MKKLFMMSLCGMLWCGKASNSAIRAAIKDKDGNAFKCDAEGNVEVLSKSGKEGNTDSAVLTIAIEGFDDIKINVVTGLTDAQKSKIERAVKESLGIFAIPDHQDELISYCNALTKMCSGSIDKDGLNKTVKSLAGNTDVILVSTDSEVKEGEKTEEVIKEGYVSKDDVGTIYITPIDQKHAILYALHCDNPKIREVFEIYFRFGKIAAAKFLNDLLRGAGVDGILKTKKPIGELSAKKQAQIPVNPFARITSNGESQVSGAKAERIKKSSETREAANSDDAPRRSCLGRTPEQEKTVDDEVQAVTEIIKRDIDKVDEETMVGKDISAPADIANTVQKTDDTMKPDQAQSTLEP